ncbi:hypothetical protein, partial [Dietzia massiliensis]|uniref:hypothetical protein n=1 Tax=Dietzia massiliensis TaxID=2697499 RepID=UPI001BCE19FD
GSLAELTEPGGSLDPDTGSLNTLVTGSVDALEAGSSNLGSGDIVVAPGSGTGSDSEDLMALGSLVAGGIAVGLAVQGGIALPPLPEINVGAVCQLPQEAIDFLKNNGSMERDECEPEDQQN